MNSDTSRYLRRSKEEFQAALEDMQGEGKTEKFLARIKFFSAVSQLRSVMARSRECKVAMSKITGTDLHFLKSAGAVMEKIRTTPLPSAAELEAAATKINRAARVLHGGPRNFAQYYEDSMRFLDVRDI